MRLAIILGMLIGGFVLYGLPNTKEVLMQPEINMERWNKQWPPIPNPEGTVSGAHPKPPRRARRSSSRRPRSEATRTMLELLRALAQSEANTLEQAGSIETITLDQPQAPTPATEASAKDTLLQVTPASAESANQPSGLMLLRAKVFGPEPEDVELHCHYCDRVFKLQDGGATFEGNAACCNCEQHLNRDFVLPAVSKHRPHLYQVCDVAEGPDDPKRPAWARERGQSRCTQEDPEEDQTSDEELDEAAAESLQEA